MVRTVSSPVFCFSFISVHPCHSQTELPDRLVFDMENVQKLFASNKEAQSVETVLQVVSERGTDWGRCGLGPWILCFHPVYFLLLSRQIGTEFSISFCEGFKSYFTPMLA